MKPISFAKPVRNMFCACASAPNPNSPMPPDEKSEVLRGRCSVTLKERAMRFCQLREMSEATLVRLAVQEYLHLQENGPYIMNASAASNIAAPAPNSGKVERVAQKMYRDALKKARAKPARGSV